MPSNNSSDLDQLLCDAARVNNLAEVERLIKLGANKNATDQGGEFKGKSAWWLAMLNRHRPEVAEYLYSIGVNVPASYKSMLADEKDLQNRLTLEQKNLSAQIRQHLEQIITDRREREKNPRIFNPVSEPVNRECAEILKNTNNPKLVKLADKIENNLRMLNQYKANKNYGSTYFAETKNNMLTCLHLAIELEDIELLNWLRQDFHGDIHCSQFLFDKDQQIDQLRKLYNDIDTTTNEYAYNADKATDYFISITEKQKSPFDLAKKYESHNSFLFYRYLCARLVYDNLHLIKNYRHGPYYHIISDQKQSENNDSLQFHEVQETILHYAVRKYNTDIIDICADAGIDFEYKNAHGQTALQLAIMINKFRFGGTWESILSLIKAGAKIDEETYAIALNYKHEKCIDHFESKYNQFITDQATQHIISSSQNLNNLFCKAVIDGNLETAKYLLNLGADINAKVSTGQFKNKSAWWIAMTHKGEDEIANYLYKKGAIVPETFNELIKLESILSENKADSFDERTVKSKFFRTGVHLDKNMEAHEKRKKEYNAVCTPLSTKTIERLNETENLELVEIAKNTQDYLSNYELMVNVIEQDKLNPIKKVFFDSVGRMCIRTDPSYDQIKRGFASSLNNGFTYLDLSIYLRDFKFFKELSKKYYGDLHRSQLYGARLLNWDGYYNATSPNPKPNTVNLHFDTTKATKEYVMTTQRPCPLDRATKEGDFYRYLLLKVVYDNLGLVRNHILGKTNRELVVPPKWEARLGQKLAYGYYEVQETILHWAVRKDYPELVPICAEAGIDFEYENPQKLTALQLAIAFNKTELVVSLLQHGAILSKEALSRVIKNANQFLIELILSHKPPLIGNEIELAITENNISAMELLLSYGANISEKCLLLTISIKNRDMTDLLLVNNAPISEAVVQHVMDTQDANLFESLFKYGIQISPEQVEAAIKLANTTRNRAIIIVLVNQHIAMPENAIELALTAKHKELVSLLLEQHAELQPEQQRDTTTLEVNMFNCLQRTLRQHTEIILPTVKKCNELQEQNKILTYASLELSENTYFLKQSLYYLVGELNQLIDFDPDFMNAVKGIRNVNPNLPPIEDRQQLLPHPRLALQNDKLTSNKEANYELTIQLQNEKILALEQQVQALQNSVNEIHLQLRPANEGRNQQPTLFTTKR